ncbi:MAG TPA: heavy-metal-associated domain-containing protein [Gemmatimonas sp.]|nr:heavy-metal-associated domain-containing protein [Gemmatimonas sp.]
MTSPTSDAGTQRLDLTIAVMTCGHCISAVRETLHSLPGITVEDVGMGKASVTLAGRGASPAEMIEAIREAGYQAAISVRAATDAKTGLPQAETGGSCCSSR